MSITSAMRAGTCGANLTAHPIAVVGQCRSCGVDPQASVRRYHTAFARSALLRVGNRYSSMMSPSSPDTETVLRCDGIADVFRFKCRLGPTRLPLLSPGAKRGHA